MLPTRTADHPLNRYADSDNLRRSQAVSRSAEASAPIRPTPPPGLSVLILNLDRPDLLVPLLSVMAHCRDAFESTGLGFEVVVGDTGSTDPAVLAAYEDPPQWLHVVKGLEYQFSRCNNICQSRATPYDRILLLNNDVILTSPDALLRMVAVFDEHPETGIVGLCLDFPDGTVQHRGIDLLREGPLSGFPFHPQSGEPADRRPGTSFAAIATTGACLMVRSEVWNAAGGLDEGYMSECQDIDLCLSAHRLGWGIRVLDAGPVVHLENATRPAGDESWPDRRLMTRRWQSFIEANFL